MGSQTRPQSCRKIAVAYATPTAPPGFGTSGREEPQSTAARENRPSFRYRRDPGSNKMGLQDLPLATRSLSRKP
jgi:hypothetical protein